MARDPIAAAAVIAASVLVLCIGAFGIRESLAERELLRSGIRVEGIVTAKEPKPHSKARLRYIRYRFVAGGRTVEGRDVVSPLTYYLLWTGGPLRIVYAPGDPSRHGIESELPVPLWWQITIVIGGICLLILGIRLALPHHTAR